mgnify:CR=1 FL=1
MYNLLIILIIVVAVLLVLVVLAQNSKGGGLNSSFGGGGSNQMIGVKKTTDLLERITWGLAIALFVLTLATKIPAITGIGASSGESNPEGIEANPGARGNSAPQATPVNPSGDKKPAASGNKKPSDNKPTDKK